MNRVGALLALLALTLGGAGEAGGCLVAPVAAPVAAGFEAPDCPYCAGHRGIEYATSPGDEVRAASTGTVAFAGTVAGIHWVVVDDLPDRKVSYGYLRTIRVVAGQRVSVGEVLGSADDRLYLGVRSGAEPVDPGPLLGGARPVALARLVPTDGSPARPARVITTACATDPIGR